MKYIRVIELHNFQSHIETKLTFSSGLNVIVGPSDSGKTAIIRAIKWVLYDEPQGDSVIRTGTEEVSVKIEMSDGSRIEKSRKKKKTVYVLYDALTEQEEVFQGSRGDVKQRVGNILGMRFDADGGKTSFNLQEQLEAPFLLSASGSSKAVAIGELIGLDVIDDATQGTRTDITAKKQQINRLIKEEQRLDEILTEYRDLDSVSVALERMEHCLSDIIKKKKHMDSLSDLLMKKKQLGIQITEVRETVDKYIDLEKRAEVLQQLELKYNSYRFQTNLLERHILLKNGIVENLTIIADTENVHSMEKMLECLQKKSSLFSRLSDFLVLTKKMKIESDSVDMILKRTSGIDRIEGLERLIDERKRLLGDSTNLLDIHSKIRNEEEKVLNDLKRRSSLDRVIYLEDQIETKVKILEELKENVASLNEYESRLEKGHLYLAERESDIKEKTTEYETIWSKEERCPTCLRPISVHDMKNIMCELEG